MAPPSATLAHSLGHNTLGKTDIAVQSVLLAIVFISVGLRLWSRRLQRISLQLNDLLIIVATVRLSFYGFFSICGAVGYPDISARLTIKV